MTLTRTWGALLLLSGLTTALAALDPLRPVLVPGVLALSGLKARLILGQFLELHKAPTWRRGFDLVLVVLLLAFATLGLAG